MSSELEGNFGDPTIARLGLKALTDEKTRITGVRFKSEPFELCNVPFWPEYLMSNTFEATATGAPESVMLVQREFASRRERTVKLVPVVADAVTSFPMTPVTLGNLTVADVLTVSGKELEIGEKIRAPVVFPCHNVVLDVIMAQWKIPSCYTIETLASLIANLDLHPNVIGFFFAMMYCDLSSYTRTHRVVMLASAVTVLSRLGVNESDKNYALLINELETEQQEYMPRSPMSGDAMPSMVTLIHWCVWVDQAYREPIISRVLVKCLLKWANEGRGEFSFGDVKAVIVQAFPNWEPCERFLLAVAEGVFSNARHVRVRSIKAGVYADDEFKGVDWWQSSCIDYVTEHVFGLKAPSASGKKSGHTVALPPADYTIVVPSAGKRFNVHSWVMVQWPYFVRVIEAGLSETTNKTLELPADMPLVVVEYLLAVLYGADPLSNMYTGAVVGRMFPDGAMFLLRNASLYEMLADDDNVEKAGRLQTANEFTCAMLYRILRQVETTCSVVVPAPKKEQPGRGAHMRVVPEDAVFLPRGYGRRPMNYEPNTDEDDAYIFSYSSLSSASDSGNEEFDFDTE